MPKSTYDKWVKDAVLLSARDGTFVIGAYSGYARDWLESRLTSTVTRLLTGICNRSIEVRFEDLAATLQNATRAV
jgi:chromosomal replication initiator protein